MQVSIAKAEYNESGFIPKKKKKKNIMSPVKKMLLIAAWQRWKVESCKESCIFSLSLPLPLCKKFYLESIFFLTFPRLCSYAFALEIARGGGRMVFRDSENLACSDSCVAGLSIPFHGSSNGGV